MPDVPAPCYAPIYLVVIDESHEMPVALRYACSHACLTGGNVAMLYAIEPPEEGIQPWAGVQASLDQEAMAKAKRTLAEHETTVQACCGKSPIVYIRQGVRREALLRLLREQPEITALVLAAHTGEKGPGPLVGFLTSAKGSWELKIPVVIVPDSYQFPADATAL